jgi:hypothetical protein
LLRSAFKDRIEGLVRGVQGGVYSPNEARNEEGLDDVKFGEEPRVQAQVVPLSAASGIPTAPTSPGPHGAPGQQPGSQQQQPQAKPDDAQREFQRIRAAADRIGRNRFRS